MWMEVLPGKKEEGKHSAQIHREMASGMGLEMGDGGKQRVRT